MHSIVRKTPKGFSLIEVLISLIIAVVIFAALSKGMIGGSFLLKQVENKSRASGVTATKTEEYLAKSFSSLQDGFSDSGTEDFGTKPVFDWAVNVSQHWLGDDPGTVDLEGIPYKLISVSTSYDETDYNSISQRKSVHFDNIVPYPYVHANIQESNGPATVPFNSYSSLITIPVSYEVPKDLMVIYNIAIKVNDPAGIGASDTIYTQCKVDGNPKDIITRTPIITQPLISNVVGVNNVSRGSHTITVEWYKDINSGTVTLKDINVIVVAFEHKQ